MINPNDYTVHGFGPTNGASGGPPPPLGAHTAEELTNMTLPIPRAVVPGYLAEGLTLLGGKPKTGKSYFVLGIALAVAMGGCALGQIDVEEGDVLYLALEDNPHRMKRRLDQLLPPASQRTRRAHRLILDYSCPNLDQLGLEAIRAWIESRPNPRLVIIDVLNRIRPAQQKNETIYQHDVRSLMGLHKLAAEFGVAILIVHHTRKADAEDPFDCLSGSTGLTGTADAVLILARKDGGFSLYGRGRDIAEIETAVAFDQTTGAWTIRGEADEVRRSDQRERIVAALREADEPLKPGELATVTGMRVDNIKRLLAKMVKAGEIAKETYGRYRPASPPYNTGHSGHSGHSWSDL